MRTAQKRSRLRRRLTWLAVVALLLAGLVMLLNRNDDERVLQANDPTKPVKQCAPADGANPPKLTYDAPPEMAIDTSKTYTATFDTTEGVVKVTLNDDATPVNVNNFVFLARNRYYENTDIFRTDTGIQIIQGGSPHTQDGSDPGPGFTNPEEGDPKTRTYAPGDIAIARPNTGGPGSAQYFFVVGALGANLNGDPTGANPSAGTYVTIGKAADADSQRVLQRILDLHTPGQNPDGTVSETNGQPSRKVTVCSIAIGES